MTTVTGLVDAVSILRLGLVFVANMTGNLVFTGFPIAETPGFPSVPRCSPWLDSCPRRQTGSGEPKLRHDHEGHRRASGEADGHRADHAVHDMR